MDGGEKMPIFFHNKQFSYFDEVLEAGVAENALLLSSCLPGAAIAKYASGG
jgi:hypothetical protein